MVPCNAGCWPTNLRPSHRPTNFIQIVLNISVSKKFNENYLALKAKAEQWLSIPANTVTLTASYITAFV
jgi:hypothetical protein